MGRAMKHGLRMITFFSHLNCLQVWKPSQTIATYHLLLVLAFLVSGARSKAWHEIGHIQDAERGKSISDVLLVEIC